MQRELDELDRSIHEDPQPLYEDYPAECPVHRVALLDDVIPISRGLPAEVVYPELRRPDSEFPYASSTRSGDARSGPTCRSSSG